MIISSFDFSVKVQCQHVRFCELTKLCRSMFAVVFFLPTLVLRATAVLDMARHFEFSFSGGLHRIIRALVILALLGLQHRWIFGAILDIVQTLFLDTPSLGFAIAPAETRAAAIAIQVQSSLARAIDLARGFVANLPTMCATEFHVGPQ
jgi:hypothetical protein